MTREEAIAYFIDSNERIISVAKDENRYNYETQQIEDVFMRKDFEAKDIAIKALEQESKSEWQKDYEILKAYSDGANGVLDELRDEIAKEKEHAYADFEQYKVEYLGQDWEDASDSLPQDEFRYGMERCIDIINKYKTESECMEDFDEEIPKKKTFWIHDMDITFDKELTQEEMEKRFFDALKTVGVIGHRGCPN